MTHAEAHRIIAQTSRYWPDLRLSAETAGAWADRIAPYRYDAAERAIPRLADTLTRKPTIADIVTAITNERDHHGHGRHTHDDELRRIDTLLARPNIDPEARDTLQHERNDLLRDAREAAQTLQRDRDARNPDQGNPTHHLQNK